MAEGYEREPLSRLAEETERLTKTIATLVRQQDEHMEWLRSIDERLRAARNSMLVFEGRSDT